ncbi:EpsG family protein [Planococcus notacanthi]|uniref:EpsG family protein n=1 Tax=Planococcus notacanthi TaxID=3035188 RepID=A0ABT7ZEU1_9BACL|nr:EpsG family protein [Planococcus sp. APC 4016]MDN3425677.1 EpsG family protein [Planococcus sp. APC 4016]
MWLFYLLIIYILVLGAFLGFSNKSDLKKNMYIYFTFGLFLILSAFRGENVGNDTINYLNLFKEISVSDNLSLFSPRFEVGYVYLNKVLSYFSSNPQIILIVTSIIIMLGFARFISKYSKIPWLSVYLFFTLGYYGMSLNTIRLNIAIVLVLLSYDFLKNKKAFRFIFVIILASLFHRTAIFFLIAWPLIKMKITLKTIAIFCLVSIGMYFSFPSLLSMSLSLFPTYGYYVGSDYLNGEVRLASVMNMLVGISIALLGILINHQKHINEKKEISFKTKERDNEDNHNMLILLFTGISLIFISFRFNLLDRIGDYFIVFAIVYLPNVMVQLKDSKLRYTLIYFIILLFFAYVATIQMLRPEWNEIYPYSFF